jgi:hypothetical protein
VVLIHKVTLIGRALASPAERQSKSSQDVHDRSQELQAIAIYAKRGS